MHCIPRIAQIEGALIDALPSLCRQSVFLTGGITLIAITSAKITVVILGTLPILIAAAVFFGRRLRRYSRETQDQLAATNTIVEKTLQAIASVKAFANEGFELKRYDLANRRVLAAALSAARWRAVFVAFFIIALFGGIVIVLWFSAGLLQRGEITAGELTPLCPLHHVCGGRDGTGGGVVQPGSENRRGYATRT